MATAPTPTTWTGGQTTGSDAWYKFPFGHGGPDPSTFATGGNWQLPRPGFWGGIPFTQRDTQGNPLSHT
jgi:hypothetical protein